MKNYKRIRTFWILSLAVNMIPLVAYGAGKLTGEEIDYRAAQKAAGNRTGDVIDEQRAAAEKKAAAKRAAADLRKTEAAAKAAEAEAKAAEKRAAAAEKAALRLASANERSATAAKKSAEIAGARLAIANERAEAARARVKKPAETARVAMATSASERNDEEPAPSDENRGKDISLEDAKRLFFSFGAALHGSDGNQQARLVGKVPNECADKFEITNTAMSPGSVCDTDGIPGFRIRDLGGGARCMEQNHRVLCEGGRCKDLASMTGGTMPLAKLDHNTPVQFLARGEIENGSAHYSCQAFDRPLVRRTSSGISEETRIAEEAEREQQRKREIARAFHDISHCKTAEDIAAARQANEILATMGIRNYDAAKVSKNLDQRELALIAGEIRGADPEKLEELRGRLLGWAEAHSNDCSKAAPVYHAIKLKYDALAASTQGRPRRHVREGALTPQEAFELSAETMEEAMDLSCFNDRAMYALEDDARGIEVDRVEALARMGTANNMMLGPAYMQLYWTASNDVNESCFGYYASQESCISAQNAFARTQAIPNKANEATQRQYQSQIQMQQMMSQMGGMGQMSGMLPMGAMNGMAMSSGLNGGFNGSFRL